LTGDRIQAEYNQLLENGFSKEKRAVRILNAYRNFYYNDGNSTERGIIANALDIILPEYVDMKLSLKETIEEAK